MRRKQIKEKLNSIVQSNYAVIDINEYNSIIYDNIVRLRKINEIKSIIYKNIKDRNKIIEIEKILNSY